MGLCSSKQELGKKPHHHLAKKINTKKEEDENEENLNNPRLDWKIPSFTRKNSFPQ